MQSLRRRAAATVAVARRRVVGVDRLAAAVAVEDAGAEDVFVAAVVAVALVAMALPTTSPPKTSTPSRPVRLKRPSWRQRRHPDRLRLSSTAPMPWAGGTRAPLETHRRLVFSGAHDPNSGVRLLRPDFR